jgi:prepilin-type N-terminal cleavage/methylation domain-containing protein
LGTYALTMRGFTLIEVLTVVFIVSVLLGVAAPATVELYRSYERSGTLQLLIADVRRASGRAALLGTRVVFSIDATGEAYSFGPDYPPYSAPAAAETVEFNRTLPRSISISPKQNVIFDSRGVSIDASGNPTALHYVVSQNGKAFSNLTITPVGAIEFE